MSRNNVTTATKASASSRSNSKTTVASINKRTAATVIATEDNLQPDVALVAELKQLLKQEYDPTNNSNNIPFFVFDGSDIHALLKQKLRRTEETTSIHKSTASNGSTDTTITKSTQNEIKTTTTTKAKQPMETTNTKQSLDETHGLEESTKSSTTSTAPAPSNNTPKKSALKRRGTSSQHDSTNSQAGTNNGIGNETSSSLSGTFDFTSQDANPPTVPMHARFKLNNPSKAKKKLRTDGSDSKDEDSMSQQVNSKAADLMNISSQNPSLSFDLSFGAASDEEEEEQTFSSTQMMFSGAGSDTASAKPRDLNEEMSGLLDMLGRDVDRLQSTTSSKSNDDDYKMAPPSKANATKPTLATKPTISTSPPPPVTTTTPTTVEAPTTRVSQQQQQQQQQSQASQRHSSQQATASQQSTQLSTTSTATKGKTSNGNNESQRSINSISSSANGLSVGGYSVDLLADGGDDDDLVDDDVPAESEDLGAFSANSNNNNNNSNNNDKDDDLVDDGDDDTDDGGGGSPELI